MKNGKRMNHIEEGERVQVADAIASELSRLGFAYIFGAPGTTELPFLEAITRGRVAKYIFTAHDTVAVGMADGYARVTERPALVNLHSAQGTLNAAGFIRVAMRDGVPIVIIAGVPAWNYAIHEPNHFQDGLNTVLRPLVKWLWTIGYPGDALVALRRACTISMSPPKGPTCVLVPQNLWSFEAGELTGAEIGAPYELWSPITVPDRLALREAVKLLKNAVKPILFVGNGARSHDASLAITEMAEATAATIMFEALDRGPQVQGVYCPGNHPLCVGFFDSRLPEVVRLLKDADTVVFVGCKATYPRVIGMLSLEQRVIQIDEDPIQSGKNHSVQVFLLGNIPSVIRTLTKVFRSSSARGRQSVEMASEQRRSAEKAHSIQKIRLARSAWEASKKISSKHHDGAIQPGELLAALMNELPEHSIIVDDSQCLGYYLKAYGDRLQPGQLFGSMASHIGWALPAALGVKLASQSATVVALVGDGSFIFSVQAIATARRFGIPITVVVANNLGYMSLKLEKLATTLSEQNFADVLSMRSTHMDFAAVARAFGLNGYRVERSGELSRAFRSAFSSSHGSVIDVRMSDTPKDWEESWRVSKKAFER